MENVEKKKKKKRDGGDGDMPTAQGIDKSLVNFI